MRIIDFLNTNKNWEEILQNPPYNLIIKKHKNYILLKYNFYKSDFNLEEV